MAKKKESQLSYLQMPLPSGKKSYRMAKLSWSGLNKKQTIDTGELSLESNISTQEAPYLTPSPKWSLITDKNYKKPLGMFGFDSFLITVFAYDSQIWLEYFPFNDKGKIDPDHTYRGIINRDDSDTSQRCVVQFNKYLESEDIVNGEYTKRLLFFPDKASMHMCIVDADTDPKDWDESELEKADRNVMYCYTNEDDDKFYYTVTANVTETDDGESEILYEAKQNGGVNYFICGGMDVTIRKYYNSKEPYLPPATANQEYYYQNTYDCEATLHGKAIYKYSEYEEDGKVKQGWKISVPPNFPNIKYATVHVSRLFGVSDDSVYASGFNDYSNWNLDSLGSYNESNAWCSKAQSNTKADGNFTGITNFQGHVVCFKRDFMHEIYNTKNPFRIQDIYAEGCIDQRSIQDVDGKLIFVSEDNVKVYTGSNPRIISYKLNIGQYEKAISGTDNRNYYLYCEDDKGKDYLFVYDTYVDQWSEQVVSSEVIGFAHNRYGMFALRDDGIFRIDSGEYSGQTWSFETDLITNQTVNIKHLKKIQMLVDVPEDVKGKSNSGANLKVYMLYDEEKFSALNATKKEARLVYASSGFGRKAIRVKPRNTASYGIKLHIEGKGYVKLYELELFMENGGGLYVSN